MEKQGLSFRGALFLVTIGTGVGALLPVIAGLQRLTIYWWLGVLVFLVAVVLRIFLEPIPVSHYDQQR